MLIFLTGARGSGKTTLLNNLNGLDDISILQPSTTRKKRGRSDKEYQFVKTWNEDLYSWSIKVGDHDYGTRKTEVEKARVNTAITVFDPLSVQAIDEFRTGSDITTLTIGLDTIPDLDTQVKRVSADSNRLMSQENLDAARKVVQQSDLVLTGTEEQVLAGAIATIELLTGRGGIVSKVHLSALIEAGSIITGTNADGIKSASYDLRIGNQVWCQGHLIDLNDSTPTFTIPPYSYAIVTAREEANLPTFLVGRFDIKISLFLRGVILSNGPQIDPGYKGQLFCMLFNGSSDGITLARDSHFSTIEFSTTSANSEAYADHYQLRRRLETNMTESGLSGQGGNIVSDFDKRITKISGRLDGAQTGALAIVAALVIGLGAVAISTMVTLNGNLVEAEKLLTKIEGIAANSKTQNEASMKAIETETQLSIKTVEAVKTKAIAEITTAKGANNEGP